MILIIDNYDSFTYNLVQRIGELQDPPGAIELKVVRNDKITVEEAIALKPERVIISPGPCTPCEAGISVPIIRAFAGKVPLLGVCLGHQSIGQAYGMVVERNERVMHGKTSPIHHDGKGLFRGLPNPFTATRYHSLVIRRDSLDLDRFELTAWTEEGEVMGLRAKPGIFAPAPGAPGSTPGSTPGSAPGSAPSANAAGDPESPCQDAPLEGVQFHPESFLTDEGPNLLKNFLSF